MSNIFLVNAEKVDASSIQFLVHAMNEDQAQEIIKLDGHTILETRIAEQIDFVNFEEHNVDIIRIH